jgi:adenosylcobinamide-phosphate synthase
MTDMSIISLSSILLLMALLLDYYLGELPNRWHPLVWFGHSAHWLETRLNLSQAKPMARFIAGTGSVVLLVGAPVALLIGLLMLLPLWANILLNLLVLYFCLGWQSLRTHALAIATPLAQQKRDEARAALSMIVSRDTATLSERQIAAATVESVLENGNDAIFATIFWFALLGAPAALAHRLVNTLDGMWGYRNDRFEYFGKTAARLDDLLGYLPARLSALSYALVSRNTQLSLTCWWRQASKHDSPNAGVVMAAGAGALKLRLGGSAIYHGVREQRPVFGIGKAPKEQDIQSALRLINKSLIAWLVVLVALWP